MLNTGLSRAKFTTMAELYCSSVAVLLSFSLLLLVPFTTASGENDGFIVSVSPADEGRKEKMSHLRFFWHDIVSGRNPSVVQVAGAATNTSKTFFGMVVIMDDPLTAGPKLSSKLVGRAQGLYASAAKDELGLLMMMNFAFVEGKYNGSSLAVLGRNTVLSDVREMPIVGGSGLFKFARGYCEARTHWFDLKSGDATVEYNVYVIHY